METKSLDNWSHRPTVCEPQCIHAVYILRRQSKDEIKFLHHEQNQLLTNTQLSHHSQKTEIKDNFEQFPFCISSPGALKLDILARSSSRLEFQFSILFFTIRTAVLIFLFSV